MRVFIIKNNIREYGQKVSHNLQKSRRGFCFFITCYSSSKKRKNFLYNFHKLYKSCKTNNNTDDNTREIIHYFLLD